MKISSICFNDGEIKHTIDSTGLNGVCDITKRKGTVLDIEYFSDFFSGLLNVFDESTTSKVSLAQQIQKDWNIFSDETTANTILSECIKLYRPKFNSQQVEYIPQISDFIALWQQIRESLQHQNHYFTNLKNGIQKIPCLKNILLQMSLFPREVFSIEEEYSLIRKDTTKRKIWDALHLTKSTLAELIL